MASQIRRVTRAEIDTRVSGLEPGSPRGAPVQLNLAFEASFKTGRGRRLRTWYANHFASGRRHGTRICIDERLRTPEVPMSRPNPEVQRRRSSRQTLALA